MGFLSILRKVKQREKEVRIILLGLDNAGKTTVVKKFNGEPIEAISPTLGFDIRTFEHRGMRLNVSDVGGQKSIRSYWRNYFEATDGVVWVVDAADDRRLDQTEAELAELLRAEKLAGASLLVFVNKVDLLPQAQQQRGSCPAAVHLRAALAGVTNRHWRIVPCSAVTGEGLAEGMDWLVDDISSRIFMFD
jgi:ADP-ribosylation factor-like protein 2